VQALQAAGPHRPPDARVELGPQPALLLLGGVQARRQSRVRRGGSRPPLDAAGRLEPGDRGDEERARDVELRRERPPRGVERLLLGHGRAAERAANRDPPERARLPPELALDELLVRHSPEARRLLVPVAPCRDAAEDEKALA